MRPAPTLVLPGWQVAPGMFALRGQALAHLGGAFVASLRSLPMDPAFDALTVRYSSLAIVTLERPLDQTAVTVRPDPDLSTLQAMRTAAVGPHTGQTP